jgi:hypothetical protein
MQKKIRDMSKQTIKNIEFISQKLFTVRKKDLQHTVRVRAEDTA